MAVQEFHKDIRTHLRLLAREASAALSEAEADALYLRLDTTNDPLTDELEIAGGVHLNTFDNSRFQAGQNGSGHATVLGQTVHTDAAALNYRAYFAYDCYWDDTADQWVANRTSLGRKFVQDMGYHNNSIRFRSYDGVVSSPWADSAWLDMLTVSPSSIDAYVPTYVRSGNVFRAYNAANTNYLQLQGSTEGAVRFEGGNLNLGASSGLTYVWDSAAAVLPRFRVYEQVGVDFFEVNVDGTNANFVFSGVADLDIEGVTDSINLYGNPVLRHWDAVNTGSVYNRSVDWSPSVGSGDGWIRIAQQASASGRGACVIHLQGNGGNLTPAPLTLLVHGNWNSGAAPVTVLACDEGGAFSLVRSGYDATNGKYIDIQLSNVSPGTFSVSVEGYNPQGGAVGWVADIDTTAFTPTDSHEFDPRQMLLGLFNNVGDGVLTVDDSVGSRASIQSAVGDAILRLQADTTNTVETANPMLIFEQDGGVVQNIIGSVGNANVDANGNTFTGMANNGFAIHSRFTTGTISLGVNTRTALTVDDNDRVYIGQDRIGYLEEVTGGYGSVQVAGTEGSAGGYEGYSIAGLAALMRNTASGLTGIYNDLDSEWLLYGSRNGELRLFYNGLEELRTTDSDASDQMTGAEVRHFDQAFYPVGIGPLPHTNITAATTLSDTHQLKAIRWTGGAANLAVTCNNDATMRVNSWGMIWNESGSDKRVTMGTGVTGLLYDGAGGLTKTAGQFFTLASGGNITWTKISDTLYRFWGIGVS